MEIEKLKTIISNLTQNFSYFHNKKNMKWAEYKNKEDTGGEVPDHYWSHFNIDGSAYWIVKRGVDVCVFDFEKTQIFNSDCIDLAILHIDLNN
jgi:hypothetical protein